MTSSSAPVLTVRSPNDLLVAAAYQLGFVPTESVLVICLHGRRGRVGLVMRFDLVPPAASRRFVDDVAARVVVQRPDRVVVAIFSAERVDGDGLPHAALVGDLLDSLDADVAGAFYVRQDRWWSYLCEDECCRRPGGMVLDFRSESATALGAAFAYSGHALLADREAVVQSVQCTLCGAQRERAKARIERARGRHRDRPVESLRGEMRDLIGRLVAVRRRDPRAAITDRDAAEFGALAAIPVVRDEVLMLAAGPDERSVLLSVLTDLARRTPSPLDPPVCSLLAWIAYANGDGVIASVCVERARASDPDYSLAVLIDDALLRQVPPRLFDQVTRRAARALQQEPGCGG